MTRQRFSVDTNLLIYSIDKDAGLRHAQARDLMDALADADCVLTLQALAEFFHAATRKGKMPAAEAAALVHDWMELFPVAAAEGRTLRQAIALRAEHGFGFWDAMLVEAARAAGVTRLLTEDMQDGRRVGALLLENPFKAGFDLALD
jgi:predicted nucleic acid-binding protein